MIYLKYDGDMISDFETVLKNSTYFSIFLNAIM